MRRAAAAVRRSTRPLLTDKDAKAVLYNWASHMGMLRGVEEHELAVSLEYQGNGTMQVEGQPCTLKKYRVSTNYQTQGQRTQIECTRPNGQTYSNIEVVNGRVRVERRHPRCGDHRE